MKLAKYEDKSNKKRKIILISLGVIVLISVSIILYKTFASFSEEVEFPIMKGKVDYFGNSDVYFAFYNGDVKLDEMPEKDNADNLVFDYGECDNGTSVEWNNDRWSPLIVNLNQTKTKCSLHFKEKTSINVCNKYGNDSALCYITKLGDTDYENMLYDHASANGVVDNNLRYIGINPNNYVLFNGEKWRIIGVMNNVTEVVENNDKIMGSYIKIIRDEDLGRYSWDSSLENINNGAGINEWSQADIQIVLNNDYYNWNNQNNKCFSGVNDTVKECPNWEEVGIKADARNMIANIEWHTGGVDNYGIASSFYEKERGTMHYNSKDYEVERKDKWIGHIGLVYPSDVGYAVGGNLRTDCLNTTLEYYNEKNCKNANWIIQKPTWWMWTMTTQVLNGRLYYACNNEYGGQLGGGYSPISNFSIMPVLYLKTNVKIEKDEGLDYGSENNPFRLSI